MPSVHVAGVHPEEICARRARPAGSASVVASVAARLTPRTAPHRTIEPETRNREARTRFPDRHGARREMRVHLAFMGAERAVSVCYDTMPPDAGRVTAASYVGRCEARWRGPRDHGAPREPPRFEPLTFGLDRKGTKGQRARLGAAGLSFAVRWVDPLDVARFVGGRPRRAGWPVAVPRRSGFCLARFLFHPFNASSARTHKLSLCRQG